MMGFVSFTSLQLAIFATFQQYLIVFVSGYADLGEMITKSLASKASLSSYHFCFLNQDQVGMHCLLIQFNCHNHSFVRVY